MAARLFPKTEGCSATILAWVQATITTPSWMVLAFECNIEICRPSRSNSASRSQSSSKEPKIRTRQSLSRREPASPETELKIAPCALRKSAKEGQRIFRPAYAREVRRKPSWTSLSYCRRVLIEPYTPSSSRNSESVIEEKGVDLTGSNQGKESES